MSASAHKFVIGFTYLLEKGVRGEGIDLLSNDF
jgi:hypothetical protein